ncbi:ClcB-like voltage-gated chloride channel protein [Oligella urethralis]|uniref:Voltage-gated ClC-type chloride channel ClcB n=1 Tax=Oligella urethralis TaxID=90245 RepID=A0A2X1UXP0_9BURK|nr:ClcB-like voltage-gated chloride channel protein [Oligella urethralis]SPY08493.1 Voltage-gated ClC-type chloride channel ClcB [Oligella urethralis]SUA58712.1 Voltage-gated ClC-type chloride channel ClcB [Oligella urethralis]
MIKRRLNYLRRRLSSRPVFHSQAILLFWALLMGVIGALATLLFFQGVKLLQWLMVGRSGSISDIVSQYSTWQTLLYPSLAGLVGGLLLTWSARIKTDTNSDYMEAVALGDGRLSIKQGVLRILSSLTVITSGFSIGREGPMIHMGSMISSAIGRFFFMDAKQLRLIVACGAAGAVSAAYHTPIAGALFVAEIVVGSMSMVIVAPLLLAAMTAHLTTRYFGSHYLAYEVNLEISLSAELLIAAVLVGLLGGILSPLFLKTLDWAKKGFKFIPLPLPLRMSLAGLVVGVFLLYDPRLAGNGDSIVSTLIHGADWNWQLLAMFLFLKVAATLVSVGSGAVGGVITPIMFIGAAVALLSLNTAMLVFPELHYYSPVFVILGMGAFLSAASSAPLMAIIMMVEMSYNQSLVVPVVFACVSAAFLARRIKGLVMFNVTTNREEDIRLRHRLSNVRIEQLINKKPENVIHADTLVGEAIDLFTELSVRYLYVINDKNEFLGVLAHKDITRSLLGALNLEGPIPAHLISRTYLEPLHLRMTLDEVQDAFVTYNGERLPVLDFADPPHLMGVVYKSEVLRRYSEIKKSIDKSSEVKMNPFIRA